MRIARIAKFLVRSLISARHDEVAPPPTHDGPRPWLTDDGNAQEGKRHAPATLRNRDAIADVLAQELPDSGTVLEIASGSGEHAVHFAERFAQLIWQPSDPDPAGLESIAAWVAQSGLTNIRPPLKIDAAAHEWLQVQADAMLCINMVHISDWGATLGLLSHAGALLPDNGLLYIYGPFIEDEVETASSNLAFDRSLRERNARWGLRLAAAVAKAAAVQNLRSVRRVAMPANNLSLVFRRRVRS